MEITGNNPYLVDGLLQIAEFNLISSYRYMELFYVKHRNMITLKNKFHQLLLIVFTSMLFLSCQKDLNYITTDGVTPDLTTKVTSSVSGFVTDENNAAVKGASVTAGGISTTTDKYGFFEIKNIQVVKNAAVVTVSKTGYFKGIKTYIATDNKAAFFRIKLIPKTSVGTINSTTGGSVSLSNGLIIALPVDGVVNASTNAAYSGVVNVTAHWIDPTATDLNQIMPGDLRGINTAGSLKRLITFGMAAVELTGASGELLQIATGKKATLTMPIPAGISSAAAATIPLWSFDEANGLWKEEGTATKTGNTYVGEVSHFSFWNCDQPANYIQFDCTVKDAAGNAIPYTLVKITVSGGTNPFNSTGYGYTDSSGYVGGLVPDNAQLLLEIFTNYNCGTPIYSQNFTTTSINVSLGIITINTSQGAANISGTVTDCNNIPVTNGSIVMLADNQYYRYPLSITGSFNFSTILCNSTANPVFFAEDAASQQQSALVTQTIVPGTNAIGNIQACGTSIQQYITYTVNGFPPDQFVYPTDSVSHAGNVIPNNCSVVGSKIIPAGTDNISFSFPTTGIAAGSVQLLTTFAASQTGLQTSVTSPVNVNITEYGAVGEFIAGYFSGSVTATGSPGTIFNIVCGFRVRRIF